jgi:hypothetical protein
MANPDDEPRQIVNIKGIRTTSWERARAASARSGETLGAWVSRALDQLADRESGERFLPAATPPANPANPAAAADLAAIGAALMGLAQAGGTAQARVVREVNRAIFAQAGGQLAPRKPRLIAGKAGAGNGKASDEQGGIAGISAGMGEHRDLVGEQ